MLPSAGNAGISAAAYCKEAGIKCHVFLPETIPSEYKKPLKKIVKMFTCLVKQSLMLEKQ